MQRYFTRLITHFSSFFSRRTIWLAGCLLAGRCTIHEIHMGRPVPEQGTTESDFKALNRYILDADLNGVQQWFEAGKHVNPVRNIKRSKHVPLYVAIMQYIKATNPENKKNMKKLINVLLQHNHPVYAYYPTPLAPTIVDKDTGLLCQLLTHGQQEEGKKKQKHLTKELVFAAKRGYYSGVRTIWPHLKTAHLQEQILPETVLAFCALIVNRKPVIFSLEQGTDYYHILSLAYHNPTPEMSKALTLKLAVCSNQAFASNIPLLAVLEAHKYNKTKSLDDNALLDYRTTCIDILNLLVGPTYLINRAEGRSAKILKTCQEASALIKKTYPNYFIANFAQEMGNLLPPNEVSGVIFEYATGCSLTYLSLLDTILAEDQHTYIRQGC